MPDNQEQTPLFTGLIRYLASEPFPFHVPGHKGGRDMDPEFRDFLGAGACALDLTTIQPLESLLREAQALAAQAFGADYTWFSVQGTSTPLMAMLMAVCSPGDSIILPRNIHRSILAGLILSGAKPIFLQTAQDPLLGIQHQITPRQVEQALELYPETKAVLVINPTYYGFTADLAQIVELAHAKGVPVLVDEAHGAHLYFHEKLPLGAIRAGADLVAVSTHKLGGSLSQSSFLHLKGHRIAARRVETMLSTLTTTSPSFLLQASLDAARRYLVQNGRVNMERALRLSGELREQINAIPGLWCPGQELVGRVESVFSFDPTKLLIHVWGLGITGYQVEQWLLKNAGVQVELSDLQNILCIITGGDDEHSKERLLVALEDLSAQYRVRGKKRSIPGTRTQPRLALTPREAFYGETQLVSLEEAIGQIVGEPIMTYPPGIPLILPGEILDQSTYQYIQSCQSAGLKLLGPEDAGLAFIRVIRGVWNGT